MAKPIIKHIWVFANILKLFSSQISENQLPFNGSFCLNDSCISTVVHLVHVNHHQPMKRLDAHKCCSTQPQTIFISNIFNTCWTQTRIWTCRTIPSSIIRCKDLLWTVAFKCRRYNLSYSISQKINRLHMFIMAVLRILRFCFGLKRFKSTERVCSCISMFIYDDCENTTSSCHNFYRIINLCLRLTQSITGLKR